MPVGTLDMHLEGFFALIIKINSFLAIRSVRSAFSKFLQQDIFNSKIFYNRSSIRMPDEIRMYSSLWQGKMPSNPRWLKVVFSSKIRRLLQLAVFSDLSHSEYRSSVANRRCPLWVIYVESGNRFSYDFQNLEIQPNQFFFIFLTGQNQREINPVHSFHTFTKTIRLNLGQKCLSNAWQGLSLESTSGMTVWNARRLSRLQAEVNPFYGDSGF